MAFIDTLIQMRNGGVAIECERSLEDVVKAVRNTGKNGKLVLTITVRPADRATPVDTVFLEDQIRADAPKPNKKPTLFFADEKNQLNRSDTRQMNMLDGIRDIDVTPQVPKEIR